MIPAIMAACAVFICALFLNFWQDLLLIESQIIPEQSVYFEAHKKQLGILKALGYSRVKIAANFWVFGLSVLIGTAVGLGGAFCFMPWFYDMQNKDHLLPEVTLGFHAELLFFLVILPTVFFMALGIVYAFFKLKMPVLMLIKDNFRSKTRRAGRINNDGLFLDNLRKTTLKSRKSLIFFQMFAHFVTAQ